MKLDHYKQKYQPIRELVGRFRQKRRRGEHGQNDSFWRRACPGGGRGALSAARTSSNTSARGPVPTRVPWECKINVLGRPTRAILELLLMLSQPLWFPCSRFGLKRPTSTRLTFILGTIMKYHHFMGPGMLGTCWGIIRYQFWNENPLLLLENQALVSVCPGGWRCNGHGALHRLRNEKE